MTQDIILVASGTVGALGFSLLFSIKNKHLIFSLLGGFLTGFIYVLMTHITDNIFIQNMVASIMGTFYCSILAQIKQLPVSVFLIPAIVPLVPGGGLYYTMNYLVTGQEDLFIQYGTSTLVTSIGISIGVIIVTVLYSHVVHIFSLVYQKTKKSRYS